MRIENICERLNRKITNSQSNSILQCLQAASFGSLSLLSAPMGVGGGGGGRSWMEEGKSEAV